MREKHLRGSAILPASPTSVVQTRPMAAAAKETKDSDLAKALDNDNEQNAQEETEPTSETNIFSYRQW